jgi:BASS family bile acid:Na+ symporter
MKTILLLLTISIGVLFPYGHEYTFLIRYFLMLMLFFSFLDVKVDKEIITKKHLVILFTILISSSLIFLFIKPFSIELAQTAFITAIAPTAIAAPVIISLKRKKVEFVAFSLLLNNFVVASLIPFMLPFVVQNNADISILDILFPILITFSVPFAAAQILKIVSPKFWRKLVNWKDVSFYILILNIYIATSDASNYIRSEFSTNLEIVFLIAGSSALLCIFFFSLGWFIGGKEYRHEASQSLGQKNNAFTIWIALTFMNPISVVGPVFYVFFQNLYISYELHKHRHSQ